MEFVIRTDKEKNIPIKKCLFHKKYKDGTDEWGLFARMGDWSFTLKEAETWLTEQSPRPIKSVECDFCKDNLVPFNFY